MPTPTIAEAYIIDAVRTPVTRRNGALAEVNPVDLGAHVLSSLITRVGVDPAAVDDVIFGCLDTMGSQSCNIARTSWLAAGLPDQVPGVTIDRQCGSSQQAVHFAAQAILSHTADLVVAGGVQNMSMIPLSAAVNAGTEEGWGKPFDSIGWRKRFGDHRTSQFLAADAIAEKWEISREDMEVFALQSHQRALRAIDEGRFSHEIVPYGDVALDSCPRPDTTLEKMAALASVAPNGRITAAVSSQICDGSSAMLLASVRAVRDHGLRPRARIHHLSCRGTDPTLVLTGPIPATEHALRLTGMKIQDFDIIEINEAFASVVLAWQKETSADMTKVNVNGGAIALGHPLGATGVKLMTTMLNELERTGGRFGLQTICEGGGLANVTIIERLD